MNCKHGLGALEDKNRAEVKQAREFIVEPYKKKKTQLTSLPCPSKSFTSPFQSTPGNCIHTDRTGYVRYVSTLLGDNCLTPSLSQFMSWPKYMVDDQGVCHEIQL